MPAAHLSPATAGYRELCTRLGSRAEAPVEAVGIPGQILPVLSGGEISRSISTLIEPGSPADRGHSYQGRGLGEIHSLKRNHTRDRAADRDDGASTAPMNLLESSPRLS